MPTKQSIYQLCVIIATLFFSISTSAQLAQCKASLKDDVLTIENSKIIRTFLWNDGDLKSFGLFNKITGESIIGPDVIPKGDLHFPGLKKMGSGGTLKVYEVAATNSSYPYIAAEVLVQIDGIEVKRIFKLYDGCPAIACDYYVRGKPGSWKNVATDADGFKNIENNSTGLTLEEATMVADKIAFSGKHWSVKSVEFFDATDYNNNLVQENTRLLYGRESRIRGNLLFATDELKHTGFFVLKEAPVSSIQLYHQGFDFLAKWGEIKCAGLGIAPLDIEDSNWVKGYSIVVGIPEDKSKTGLLQSLRNYQSKQRIYKEERDAMIVANTWGDRNRDSRVNESFILQEIEAAAKLGITHFQIDDGWQLGVSSNSAKGGSLNNIWRNPAYWDVDPAKFPGGFFPVLEAAKKANIQITLWFNPSTDSSFANWEKDADVLIAQYKKYGIRMWKIDGVQAADKTAEINFRKFLNKVMAATNHEAVFNLDVTAGRRFGYHYMYEYGNLFLENRYTDWSNYYPHYTLRNLWQLSRYIAPQRLQIEFLNKWRNASKYAADDILAPVHYNFDYLFAITMMAQPLAWFEVSGMPKEAFTLSAFIKKYKAVSADVHSGNIFPIGDEPSGVSWTGFQSIHGSNGYFLLFRESNENEQQQVKTLLPKGRKVQLNVVAGEGKDFQTMTGENGTVQFKLSTQKSFALYQYKLL